MINKQSGKNYMFTNYYSMQIIFEVKYYSRGESLNSSGVISLPVHTTPCDGCYCCNPVKEVRLTSGYPIVCRAKIPCSILASNQLTILPLRLFEGVYKCLRPLTKQKIDS